MTATRSYGEFSKRLQANLRNSTPCPDCGLDLPSLDDEARQSHFAACHGKAIQIGDSVLNEIEQKSRSECETKIREGFQTWYEVGEAFLKIRDERLYRSTHPTFEAYCREEWDMSRRKVDRLISGVEVVENLRPMGLIPDNERQARELISLEPEEQKLVMHIVKETAPNGKVTAEHVKSVVTVLKEVTQTGAIDDGTGESIPVQAATLEHIKAAVTEETYERRMRQQAHIAEQDARKKAGKASREQSRTAIPERLSGPLWQLWQGDLREQMQQLEADSLDAIITDPPYPQEYLPLYGVLAQEAARALKPGGILLAMCGQSYLPQIISLMDASLTYHWMLAYMTPGGQSPQIWPRKVNTFWKPILWYVKGEYAGDWHGDVIKSERNEKDAHHWQQSISGMADLIQKFTLPDQLILDPFCGSGTTGLACITQHRRFIGIDVDPSALAAAQERLSHV